MLCGESTTGTFGNGGGLALTREGRMQLPAAHARALPSSSQSQYSAPVEVGSSRW